MDSRNSNAGAPADGALLSAGGDDANGAASTLNADADAAGGAAVDDAVDALDVDPTSALGGVTGCSGLLLLGSAFDAARFDAARFERTMHVRSTVVAASSIGIQDGEAGGGGGGDGAGCRLHIGVDQRVFRLIPKNAAVIMNEREAQQRTERKPRRVTRLPNACVTRGWYAYAWLVSIGISG